MSGSTLMQNKDQHQIRIEINNYEHACQTIVAFASMIKHDLKGIFYQGKKLATSSKNKIQKQTEVTPDMVVMVYGSKKSDVYCAVNEIKVDLPKNSRWWLKTVRQLKKYDDDLEGWGAKTKLHDIMITTNELRTYELNEYIDSQSPDGKSYIQRPFSILHSTRTMRLGSFINIKKDHGHISNQKLDEILSRGIAVPEHNIVNEINQMKFYDAAPPTIYTMMIIWDHVIKTFLSENQLRDIMGNKNTIITITVGKVSEKLSKFAPETNPRCIKRSWVKKALLGFKEIGLASQIDDEKFEIKFRRQNGKTLDWLFKQIEKPAKKGKNSTLDQFAKNA